MKMSIALKEASETIYWLRLLRASEYLSDMEYQSMLNGCTELEKLLTSIVRTTKDRA